MDIEPTARFVGPNIFSRDPVVHYRISGTKRLPARVLRASSAEALPKFLPGLVSSVSSCGVEDAFFASSDPARSLPLAHAIEHVALALQNAGGCELGCIRTAEAGRIGRRSVILAYDEFEVVDEAAALACEIVERLVSIEAVRGDEPRPARKIHSELKAEFSARIETFRRSATRRLLPVQDRAFVRAARARDVPTRRVAGRTVELGQGQYQQRVSATKTTRTNVVSNDLAANKDFSRRILSGLALPVPRYERVYRQKQAVEAARAIGYPVVVKPNAGNMGQAVSVGVRSDREVRAAFKRAKAINQSVLVEELVEGEDFRVLVIDGRYCAASKRIPGHVVGDGVASVEELVATLNLDPRRGRGPLSPWTRLELDDQADRLLADLGMTRASVPPRGETVFLRRNANTSDGGTAIDVTDDVHPDNREIAERAARGIGLDIAGVDFLTRDISRSMWRTGGRICEINSRPGLRKHMWPANGPPRDIMTPIVEMLFPEGQPSRIPVIAVLGLDKYAARSTARLLAHLLGQAGRRVALAVEHRVYFDGRRARTDRLRAPDSARLALCDPSAEIAVLEWTVNDVVRDGLGCDAIDLALIVDGQAPIGEARVSGEDGHEGRLATRALDALGVVAQTTRRQIMLRSKVRVGRALDERAPGVEVVEVDHGWVPRLPGTALLQNSDFGARDWPDLDLACAAAVALGLSEAEVEAALESFDPQAFRSARRSR